MSKVPTRNKPSNFQSNQDIAHTYKHINGTRNHDDCLNFIPTPSNVFTPITAIRWTTTSIPTCRNTPNTSSASAVREVTRSPPIFSRSPALEHPISHTGNDVAIQSPTIPEIDLHLLIPNTAFLHEGQSPRNRNSETVDAATRHLRTPPANTSTQRKAQPIFTSYFPDIVTGYNSPRRKTQQQSGTKLNRTPSHKRKIHHQK